MWAFFYEQMSKYKMFEEKKRECIRQEDWINWRFLFIYLSGRNCISYSCIFVQIVFFIIFLARFIYHRIESTAEHIIEFIIR